MTLFEQGPAGVAPAIHASHLVKQYGTHRAVDGVELMIEPGRTVALIGHNGAGKTTLMKLILGLIRPSAGDLVVLGARPSLAGLDYRRQIGFLPENVAFHDELTGTQTLRFYADLKSAPRSQCAELLERVGLSFAAGRRVKTYSKGMRQRLGLAQALLGVPRLLLLDEPTTGLDPNSRREFFAIIRELSARGATVIISSHILTELEAQTDLVAIMKGGHLVGLGPLETLRSQAALPVRFVVGCRGSAETLSTHLADLDACVINQDALMVACPVADKMTTLARLVALGAAVTDIDIRHPGLDEIYNHFSPQPADRTGGAA
ncbi:ABC transporter ATP-binding protein [Dongia rigui]|uniref:ABC transporter ATP-binding protein n=1 Tax=Dongia rigui TaxID=940149 RepID=A0ABU5E1H5_9PROT|nr:ABC transporter ATP-binding protein [Dongia rigui]MDY0873207.1 ABC transporter ATP-binding protein [Dongia rigui]